MDQQTFEQWMAHVMPQVVQLSVEQTHTFFGQFLESCTTDQRIYLETEFSGFLKRDFMTMPALVVKKILDYLDFKSLLNLRQVCQAWREEVEGLAWLWRPKCRQCLLLSAENEKKLQLVQPFTFQFFKQSQKVLSQISEVFNPFKGINEIYIHATSEAQEFDGTMQAPVQRPYLLSYNPESNIIVAGSEAPQLMAISTKDKKILWVARWNKPSCLSVCTDLVLAGNNFGQVTVLTLKGKTLEDSFQCGGSALTALDVHPSGKFMVAATVDGLLHLVDSDFEVFSVDLQLGQQQPVSGIKTVFFLPDAHLAKHEVAVCVCTYHWGCVAVLGETGQVLHQQHLQFSGRVSSFCRHHTKRNVLYAAISVEDPFADAFSIEEHHFEIRSAGISWQVEKRATFRVVLYPSKLVHRTAQDMLLLAVGKNLAMAAIRNSVHVFRMDTGALFISALCSLGRENVTGLVHTAGTGRLIAAHTEWLDGLAPFSMQKDKPLLFFSSSETNETLPDMKPTIIKSYHWCWTLWWGYSWPQEKVALEADLCDTSDLHEREFGCAEAVVSGYRSCFPLGPWRNAALFEEKRRQPDPFSSSSLLS